MHDIHYSDECTDVYTGETKQSLHKQTSHNKTQQNVRNTLLAVYANLKKTLGRLRQCLFAVAITSASDEIVSAAGSQTVT